MRVSKPTSIVFTLLICILTSSITIASENDSKAPIVTIVSYGIYAHSPDNGKSWINPISEKNIQGKSSSPVHLNSTRTIPAQYPLFFGFEYNIDQINEQVTEITTEVTHPRIKQADGSYSTQYQQSQKFLVIDGKVTAINGYLLENNDEIQAGSWVFRIKREGKTIITQQFNVK